MATRWKQAAPEVITWRAPTGVAASDRAAEQDRAAGGRDRRVVGVGNGRAVLASVYLRLPPKSRRVYAYLRWADGRKTHEKYICQVSGTSREQNLTQAWAAVHAAGLIIDTPTHSWAESVETSNVMRGNRSRDTRPEMALRSAVHARGMRYRVAVRPLPSLRRTADLVFVGPKVAVFLDGCYWHGCPDHHRPATRNSEFWRKKIRCNQERDGETNRALTMAGWTVIRIWEHEPPQDAAERIEAVVITGKSASPDRSRGRGLDARDQEHPPSTYRIAPIKSLININIKSNEGQPVKRLARACAIIVATIVTLLSATAVPASATTTWNDVWIQQNGGALCAAVTSTTAVPVVQETCVELADQLWTLAPVYAGAPVDSITNLGTGKCMAAFGASVVQTTCTTLDDQVWTLSGTGNTFQIRNVLTGTCLSANGGSPGLQMILVACKVHLGGPRWQLLF